MKLALYGGEKIRKKPFLDYKSLGKEEIEAAKKVVESGVLSAFYGSYGDEFYGGPKIKELEGMWRRYYSIKNAISVNSATSALMIAIGAIGIGPGDEVIVTPYSMSATATAILTFNGIPIFSDIEDEYYNLDPDKIEEKITDNTKAIMVTNLFGHGARMDEIMKIARKHNLKVIEDCAQSPGTKYKGKLLGTYGDIGIFSYNCHKTIQSGEGGIALTDDDDLALKMMLIRNHAEAVIGSGMPVKTYVNMIGFNFRMTEMEAAVAIEQFKKMDKLNSEREKLCNHLSTELNKLDGIITPKVAENSNHVYYIYPVRIDTKKIKISLAQFLKALTAEGVPFFKYGKPIYLLPLYQKMIGYGDQGCPFTCPFYGKKIDYKKGLCEVVERVSKNELMFAEICRQPNTIKDMDDIAKAFKKVINHQDEILKND